MHIPPCVLCCALLGVLCCALVSRDSCWHLLDQSCEDVGVLAACILAPIENSVHGEPLLLLSVGDAPLHCYRSQSAALY